MKDLHTNPSNGAAKNGVSPSNSAVSSAELSQLEELLSSVDRRLANLESQVPQRSAVSGVFAPGLVTGLASDARSEAKVGSTRGLDPNEARYWWFSQLYPGTRVHDLALGLRLHGVLDHAALAEALRGLIAGQPALRTVFVEVDDAPLAQPIELDELGQVLRFEDLRAEPDALEAKLAEDIDGSFAHAGGPLWRLRVFRLGDRSYHLHLLMHHSISDAQSFSVFFQELGLRYAAALQGEELPPMSIEAYAGEGGTDADLAYWTKELKDSPHLELPTDRPRPERVDMRGALHRAQLDPGSLRGLKSLAQQQGVTLYALLLAEFGAFLGEVAGVDEALVGTMFSGREGEPQRRTVGSFSEALVLRLRGLDAGLSQRCAQAQSAILGAMQHHRTPLGTVVRALEPVRRPGYNVLFQTRFIMQSTLGDAASTFPGMAARWVDEDHLIGATEVDLGLVARESPDGLLLSFEYARALFDARTIEGWMARFTARLNRLVTPGLLGRIEAVASAEPARTALRYGDEKMSYGALWMEVERIARRIRAAGAQPGDRIGVMLPRSMELVVSLLASLRARVAYVPLDPEHPRARVQHALRDSGARLVLVAQDAHTPEGFLGRVLHLNAQEQSASDASLEAPEPDDLAYLIYTSGSTGVPKGVAIEHRALDNHLAAMAQALPVQDGCALLAVTTPAFDIAALELFLPLRQGGEVEVAPSAEINNGEAIAARVQSRGINIMQATPSMWRLLIDSGWQGAPGLVALCGGEALHPALAQALLARCARLFNVYGPTEATIWATLHEVKAPHEANCIGRPLVGVDAMVLDGAGHFHAHGEGELCLGGVQLARGYHGKAEMTAERFVAGPSQRLYRTGDRARIDADGRIFFEGRLDDQLKIRGFRVEPGEIEAALLSHASVREAAVVAHRNEEDVRLLGYWVGDELEEVELRAHLAARLPKYMIPGRLERRDSLPRTPNGKLNRGALKGTSAPRPSAPEGETESVVAEIWSALLERPQIPRDANFMDLGGHSLLLPKMRKQLEQRLGVWLDITELFRHTSIAKLSAHIDALKGEVKAPVLPAAEIPRPEVAEAPSERPVQRSSAPVRDKDIAIIGLGLRYPDADTPEAFWRALSEERSVAKGLSPRRLEGWRVAGPEVDIEGRQGLGPGAFLDDVAGFEPEFFHLSNRESRWMDPQQRLMLEVGWECFERAGYSPRNLEDPTVAVYVGANINDYIATLRAADVFLDPHTMSGTTLSMLSGRLSYLFGLTGPSLTVDTACSSSMVALDMGVRALRDGKAKMAMVGGVALVLSPQTLVNFDELGTLAPDGRCKPFDKRADGFGQGECAVALLLKPLSEALTDGDDVWGVIKGSAVNHDGNAKIGLMAPSPKGQAKVIRDALEDAQIAPSSIGMMEAHAPGTQLGDPIEVSGLTEALSTDSPRKASCALGSVKSTFGHAGPAAGLTGLLRALLSLRYKALPPMSGLQSPNPEILFERTPFYINDRLRPWPAGETPRRVGVTSLGYSGVNAHAVLEEAPAALASPESTAPQLFVLSARTERSLRALVERYVLALQHTEASLLDICFTAMHGRTHWPKRLAMVVQSRAQLMDKLGLIARSDALDSLEAFGVHYGDKADEAGQEALLGSLPPHLQDELRSPCPAPSDALRAAAARMFVLGRAPSAMFQGARRASLPTYAFDRTDCWPKLKKARTKKAAPAPAKIAAPAPEVSSAPADPCLSSVVWRPAPAADAQRIEAGSTLLLANESERGWLGQALQGQRVLWASPGDALALAGNELRFDPARPEHYTALLQHASEQGRLTQIVHALGLFERAPQDLKEAQSQLSLGARSQFALLQATGALSLPHGLTVRLLSRLSQPAQTEVRAPLGAGAFGLALSASIERHDLRVAALDLDDGRDPGAIAGELANVPQEVQLALRQGQRLIPSYAPLQSVANARTLRRGGVYLITGGLGRIGLALAAHLSRRYQAKLVLCSRRSRPGLNEALAAIRGFGGEVEVAQADVGLPEGAQSLVDQARARFGALHGVFHLAGVDRRALIKDKTLEVFDEVHQAKLLGALHLMRALQAQPLDFLVFFSSLAAWMPSPFYADYAAANRCLDALACWATAQGRPALSLGWGDWNNTGAAPSLGAPSLGAEPDLGIPGIPEAAERGMWLLDRALETGAPCGVAAALSEAGLKAEAVAEAIPLPAVQQPPERRAEGASGGRSDRIEAYVVQLLSEGLERATEDILLDVPFLEQGVDSVAAVSMASELKEATGQPFRSTLFFEHPTPQALCAHLEKTCEGWEPEGEGPDDPGGPQGPTPPPDGPEAPRVAAPSAPVQSAPTAVPPALSKAAPSPASAPVSAPALVGASEPIAIVGLAGRFSGAESAEALWSVVLDARSRVEPVGAAYRALHGYPDPAPGSLGAELGQMASTIDRPHRFDPQLFRIAPVEAERLLPDQRLILEVAWEALERAGLGGRALSGTDAGVFVGASPDPFRDDNSEISQYSLGRSPAILANRLSYFLDLHGPSLSVDTGCSSSLMATHLAMRALRDGECQVALVASTRVGISPSYHEAVLRTGALSPSGACHTFDQSADGFAAGEGVCAVVLKPLSRALADGDPIRAVIRGSGVAHTGQSSGLVAPNSTSQTIAIKRALADAQVTADTISYMEAHGTGTELGDPIEVRGLTDAFRETTDRKQFCAIGALKATLGHLEPVSGLAGLIKTTLALGHKTIPPLRVERPNKDIHFEETPFFVPDRPLPWAPPQGAPRRAGLSAIGIGGVTVHLVMEEAPVTQAPPAAARKHHALLLSARTPKAMDRMLRDYEADLSQPDDRRVLDICHTANVGRARLRHRVAVIGDSRASLVKHLGNARQAKVSGQVFIGEAPRRKPKLCLLFPGQGAQYPGMGKALYAQEPVFKEAMDRCDALFEPRYKRSIVQSILEGDAETLAKLAQPSIFSLEVGLWHLWRDAGLQVDAVIGHSLGEYAAAYAAGAISLEGAARLVASRDLLIQTLDGRGRTGMIGAGVSDVERLLEPGVGYAALNAPENTVISGDVDALRRVLARADAEGLYQQELPIRAASHSSYMDPILDEFEADAKTIPAGRSKLLFMSTLHGRALREDEVIDSAYWRAHLRQPVRFLDGIRALGEAGYGLFLEMGPHRTLVGMGQDALGDTASFAHSMRRGYDAHSTMMAAAAQLHVAGVDLDWAALDRAHAPRRVVLPSYPFTENDDIQPYRTQAPLRKAEPAGERVEMKSPVPAPLPAPPPVVEPALMEKLQALFAKALGLPKEEVEPEVDLLELGADSLALSQALRELRSGFGVQLSVRDIFEGERSLVALAQRITKPVAERAAQSLPVPVAPSPPAPPAAPKAEGPSASGVVARLREIFCASLKLPEEEVTADATLLELGADSLALSQAIRGLKSEYGVNLSVRQLFDELSSIDALAGYIAQNSAAPAEVTPKPQEPRPAAVSQKPVRKPVGKPARKSGGPVFGGSGAGGGKVDAAFVKRFNARTSASKARAQAGRQVMADARASAGFRPSTKELLYPIIGDRAQGTRVWDLDGNPYLDITMGFGTLLFGHAPDFVYEAIQAQLQSGIQVGPQAKYAGEVAERIARLTGHERVLFNNTGTEANMTAIRLARAATGRSKIAMFEGSYHGFYDQTLAVIGDEGHAVPFTQGLPPGIMDNLILLPYGEDEALEVIERHGSELAAVLVEPVQSRRPELQPQAFLQSLREITARHQTALIFDEVITGFRCHQGGAQAYFDVRADMCVYGKAIGGGLPVGVVAGDARFLDGIDGGYWRFGDDSFPRASTIFFAGTFNKHPLTMAATCAVLRKLEEEGPQLQTRLNQRTAALMERLDDVFVRHGAPIHTVSFSSMYRFAFTRNLDLFFYHLLEQGLYVWEGRNFFVSTAHTDKDMDEIVDAVERAVVAMNPGPQRPGGGPGSGSGPGSDSKPSSKRVAQAPQKAQPGPVAKTLPLSDGQQDIWVIAQLGETACASYNESVLVELSGPLDEEALRSALSTLIARHDALRTSLTPSGDAQRVHRDVPLPLERIEVQPGQMSAKVEALSVRPFDLTLAPLFRATLLQVSPQLHGLLLTVHHSVADGGAFAVIISELAALYSAAVEGKEAQLETPASYEDYIRWRAKTLKSDEGQAAQDYWRSRFQNGVPPTGLPHDRPAPKARSFRGGRRRVERDRTFVRRLNKRGAEASATPFMVLLGAFESWLAAVSQEPEVVVGVPSQLVDPALESPLVAHTISLLPLRLGGAPQLRETIQAAKRSLLDGMERSAFAFGALGRALGAPAALGRVMFNLERSSPPPRFAGLEVDGVGVDTPSHALQRLGVDPDRGLSKFELALNVELSRDRFSGVFEFSADLFSADAMDALTESFATFLDAALEGEPLAQAPLLGAAQAGMLERINRTEAEVTGAQTLDLAVSRAAAAQGKKTAVIAEDGALSYEALEARAGRIAHRLRAAGVSPGALVGVCMARSADLIAGLLGVMKAGAAYVPLDPEHPDARLALIIEGAKPAAVLVDAAQRGRFTGAPKAPMPEVVLQQDWLQDGPQLQTLGPPLPRALAYVMFTSGSTGRPKGVQVEHRAVMNFLGSMAKVPGLGEADTLLAVTTFAFDISVLELFLPLTLGATVVVASSAQSHDGAALATLMAQHAVTAMQATPSTWRLMLEAGWGGRPQLRALCGGEALPKVLAEKLRPKVAQLWNMYGPTETTIWSTIQRIEAAEDAAFIGHPIDNTQVHILDAALRSLPVGVVGDLYIGGEGLARGYHAQPELTAARFIERGGDRLYKTGDRARLSHDGRLEFLGRADDQIKLRGHRIELGELESALESEPGVQAAVAALKGADDPKLVAYVVPEPTSQEALETAHLADMQVAYDRTLAEAEEAKTADFQTAGWVSSYTRARIPDAQMRAWLDTTVDRLLSLKPRRVLELGCGAGLILSRVAPHVERYVGTDFSPASLAHAQSLIDQREALKGRASVLQRAAHELEGIEGGFDLVVLNSVVQYFPGEAYLRRVLEGARGLLNKGGAIFIGDVRSCALLGAFHASVEAQSEVDDETLRRRVARAIEHERELVLDPGFFEAEGARVFAMPKRGSYDNELSRFRYDVVLRFDASPKSEPARWQTWSSASSLPSVQRALADSPERLGIYGVPDPRPAAALSRYAALKGRATEPLDGLLPERFKALEAEVPYEVELRTTDALLAEGRFAVIFHRRDLPKVEVALPEEAPPRSPRCNDPLALRRRAQLAANLRASVLARLPEYMVPSAVILMDALPTTPNGKVDRRALPEPEQGEGLGPRELSAPVGPVEVAVAEVFAKVLQLEAVGREEDFFDLGGHSLLAVQLQVRLREALGQSIRMVDLLRAPTVAAVAELTSETASPVASAESPPSKAPSAITARLQEDARLPVWVEPVQGPVEHGAATLLTGATGLVGAHLLAELLRTEGGPIFCLVRAESEAAAMERLSQALAHHGLSSEGLPARVVAMPGDLSLPQLGLQDSHWARCVRDVSLIVGNGAQVSFARSYDSVRGANVLGVLELLRLSCQGRAKRMLHISTVGALPPAAFEGGVAYEQAPHPDCEGLQGGYGQSKWVAERLVAQAQLRGLDALICRLGAISGDSCTGEWSTEDVTRALLLGCASLGAAPDADAYFECTPIDFVRSALRALAESSARGVVHLANPSPARWSEVLRWTGENGHPVRVLPFEQWRAQALREAPVALRFGTLIHEEPAPAQRCDCARARTLLSTQDVECPPVDEALISRYLSGWRQRGLLQTPGGSLHA